MLVLDGVVATRKGKRSGEAPPMIRLAGYEPRPDFRFHKKLCLGNGDTRASAQGFAPLSQFQSRCIPKNRCPAGAAIGERLPSNETGKDAATLKMM